MKRMMKTLAALCAGGLLGLVCGCSEDAGIYESVGGGETILNELRKAAAEGNAVARKILDSRCSVREVIGRDREETVGRESALGSEVGLTRSRQLFLTVLDAALNGEAWYETQEVAFADLPTEFKAAYDDSEFRGDRGEAAQKATKTNVMHYDMDQDGSAEYFVYSGFCGAHDTGWMILTKNDGKWEKIKEEYGNLQKVIHDKGRGLLVSNYHGGGESSFRYYELEKGNLVMKLTLDIEYAPPKEGGFLCETPIDIKVTYHPCMMRE